MTESMNLDSADIVGGLGFDSLDTSLEEELNMYTHEEQITVNEMDMSSGVLIKDDIDEKEEVIEEQEITEEQLMEETISYDDTGMDNHNIESVMDIVDDGSNYREEDESSIAVEDNVTNVIQNDNEMFTDGVMGEEIVTNEQVIIDSEPHIYEDTASSDKDFQDINDVMSDNMMNDDSNIVSEETVVDSENMECEQTDGEKKPLHEVVSSNVYVVPHSLSSQSYIQTTGSNTSKETKVKRLLMASSEGSKTQSQMPSVSQTPTLRIVSAPQGKIVTGTSKTITFAQAKQMGIINFNQIIQPATKGGVSKLVVPKKTVTVMKSPAKILPAQTARAGQKVMIRSPGGALKTGTLLTTGTSSGGVIRIPSNQTTQLQLQSPNKQIQYVKLVGTSKGGTTLVPVQTISSLSTKTIPVALQSSLMNSSQTTFKVVPISSSSSSGQTVKQGVTPTQRVLIPASSSQVVSSNIVQTSQAQRTSVVMLQSQLVSPVKEEMMEETVKTSTDADNTLLSCNNGISQVSMSRVPVLVRRSTSTATPVKTKEETVMKTEVKSESESDIIEANGIRPRKPCNCTKSMCLKLYCDCFANGEFCHQCNCTTCYNNLSHEEERQRAIKSCLERNPSAFRPKIGKTYVGSEERRHNKGCNCRRSGCLKNYCECYEAKIPCSKNCKCIGCKNTDAFLKRGLSLGCDDDKYSYRDIKPDGTLLQRSSFDSHIISAHRQVLNCMSPQLIEATCQCLVAQVEEWGRAGSTDLDLAQALVIEELGRCLAQLIECINKSIAQIPQSAQS